MRYSDEKTAKVQEILAELKSSSGFANSPQLQNFLTFVVEKTLADETADIKGYTIGVDALGRPEDFDPTTDPSVRVMAGRLRQALDNYFRDLDTQPPVVITLEKGSYIPQFTFAPTGGSTLAPPSSENDAMGKSVPPQSNANRTLYAALFLAIAFVSAGLLYAFNPNLFSLRPSTSYTGSVSLPTPDNIPHSITSLPSVTINIEYGPTGIPDWISESELSIRAIIAFSRFREYRIYDVSNRQSKSDSDYFEQDYALSIFFTKKDNGNVLEAYLKLTQPLTGKIVWSDDFLFAQPAGEQELANRHIIAKTVTELMSPYGVIYRDIASPERNLKKLICIRQIYSYFMRESLQAFSNGLKCAQRAVDAGTASSSMHALLAFLYAEAYRRNYSTAKEDPLKYAETLADLAVRLDPQNARAFQARFAVEKISGKLDKNRVIAAADNAIELNPLDRDIAGDVAAFFIASDELELAEAYLMRALILTPVPPAWLNFYHYLFTDLAGDFDQADLIADKLDPQQSSLVAFAKLLSSDRRGLVEEKEKLVAIILKMEPDLLNQTAKAFKRRGFKTELADQLAERIAKMNLQSG
ncbi:MAG: hypothetical protein AAGA53_16370 [Pseudomonadota bacterium]